jgi:alpha-methylacyl-CoA racemase
MSRLGSFLKGVRVVDLSRHLPGPLASLLMVDMGATVIKVEPPGGEEMRFIGTPGENGVSAWFEAVNAGKTGCRLDLKSEAGREHLLTLLADADVMIESFRPDVLEKLGLPVSLLRDRFPRLVIVSLNGYGTHSPVWREVGHDINYLALNGVLEGTGTTAQSVAPWPPLADCSASLFGLSSLLAALFARERSGEGCHIEVALTDSVMPLMVFSLAELGVTGKGLARAEALLNGGAARYRTYVTADGVDVALGAVEPKFWQAFCVAAGHPEWIPRMDEPLPQTALQAELEAFFASLTWAACEARLATVECCFNRVLPLADAVNTGHIQARQLVRKDTQGRYQTLFPAWVDGEPPALREPFRDGA